MRFLGYDIFGGNELHYIVTAKKLKERNNENASKSIHDRPTQTKTIRTIEKKHT